MSGHPVPRAAEILEDQADAVKPALGHPVGRGDTTVSTTSGGVTTTQRAVRAADVDMTSLNRAHELQVWWLTLARAEVEAMAPKVADYGATDLIEIGRTLAATAHRAVSDEEAAELGVYFYLVGKLARWTDAVKRGDRPSDDTLHDIGVYVRMAQRIRETGGWPGLAGDSKQ